MIAPWRYGPPPEGGDELVWEDNWLSNSMAWFTDTFLPNWCKVEDHWTVSVLNYFYAECACCLLFRGITVGMFIGAASATLIFSIF